MTSNRLNGHAVSPEVIPLNPRVPAVEHAASALRLARGHRVGLVARKAILGTPWYPLFRSLGDTAREHRVEFLTQWLRWHDERDPAEAAGMRAALAEAEALVEQQPHDDRAEEAEAEPFSLGILGSSEFHRQTYPRHWLIKGIAVAGQPGIIGGPKKALKTTQMVDLTISLGTATRFLGEFEVPQARKVLFLSGESGDTTIQETMRRVCVAKGLDPDELEGQVFWGFTLPQLSNSEHLEALARFIREHSIEVVIVDPLYLCLLSGNSRLDPANLFDVGPLLKTVADVCLEAGATPFLVHHLRKNRENPHGPPELEDLAFAGVQEFARQWILIGRRETYEPGTGLHKLWLNVGGSAGHSGTWAVDVAEGVVDDEFQGRTWEVTIHRASEARKEAMIQAETAKLDRKAEQERLKTERRDSRFRDDVELALEFLRKLGQATPKKWRSALKWNPEKLDPIIFTLESEGRIRTCDIIVKCGKGQRPTPGYEPVPQPFDSHRTTPDHTGPNPARSGVESRSSVT